MRSSGVGRTSTMTLRIGHSKNERVDVEGLGFRGRRDDCVKKRYTENTGNERWHIIQTGISKERRT